ncbi:MAG: hypothetical protein KGJ80_21515 [Chloroflexota bacterium]|nr:hypothetical protein [Chloroflexota bacterium]
MTTQPPCHFEEHRERSEAKSNDATRNLTRDGQRFLAEFILSEAEGLEMTASYLETE